MTHRIIALPAPLLLAIGPARGAGTPRFGSDFAPGILDPARGGGDTGRALHPRPGVKRQDGEALGVDVIDPLTVDGFAPMRDGISRPAGPRLKN